MHFCEQGVIYSEIFDRGRLYCLQVKRLVVGAVAFGFSSCQGLEDWVQTPVEAVQLFICRFLHAAVSAADVHFTL